MAWISRGWIFFSAVSFCSLSRALLQQIGRSSRDDDEREREREGERKREREREKKTEMNLSLFPRWPLVAATLPLTSSPRRTPTTTILRGTTKENHQFFTNSHPAVHARRSDRAFTFDPIAETPFAMSRIRHPRGSSSRRPAGERRARLIELARTW